MLVAATRRCSNWWDRLFQDGDHRRGDVPHRQAHEVVFMLRRAVEQPTEGQILVFVMDCDVAAAFDHVAHHEIIKATLAMGVPPVLIVAWIKEYRNSRTLVTPGIRRTKSVP